RIVAVRRRGKHVIVEISDGLALLVHLMSAGRLQLYDKRAGPRDRTSRLLVRLRDGRELRLREFGSKQAAWVKLLRAEQLAQDAQVVRLPIPDKLPMPLQVHRHEGQPCPRCGTALRAVHFEDYVIAYCPACQTEGRALKDRRLSRLLR